MYKNKKILAIIPARSGSKGLKNKNVKLLNGKPLVSWPIMAAQKSKYIDKIVVSTNSSNIAKISLKYGANIPFLRPKHLSTDKAKSFDVIKNMLNFFQKKNELYDYIILLEPTSPLTTSDDIDKALRLLIQNSVKADSIVGIGQVASSHPNFCVFLNSKNFINPMQDKKYLIKRRQDISKLYFYDGSLYASSTEILLKEKSFYHKRTMGFVFPKYKNYEIDDIYDFLCVQALIKQNLRK